jgi:hypothetical protein
VPLGGEIGVHLPTPRESSAVLGMVVGGTLTAPRKY